MVLDGNEVWMAIKLKYLHSLVIVALADEFQSGLFVFVDVLRVHLIPMPVTFIDCIHIAVQFSCDINR